jgi:arylsulfatase A-like enzyme
VFTGAGDYLEHIKEAQPFFLLVDSFDPHEPWDPPRKYVDLYGDPDYSGREPTVPNYSDASWITKEELKRMRALYAGEITMTDAWLGRFLERMEKLALMETTLLILLSDHGACLGEHNDTDKPYWALYPELTDTVFMMRHPQGKGAGKRSDYFASTHDVAPTILSMLGMEKPQPMEGSDLSPIFDGKEPDQKREHFTFFAEFWVHKNSALLPLGPHHPLPGGSRAASFAPHHPPTRPRAARPTAPPPTTSQDASSSRLF